MTTSTTNNPWEVTSKITPTSYMETTSPKLVSTLTDQTQTSKSLQTSNQSQSSSGTKITNTQNMSASSLKALETLISQLMGGGTPQMQEELNRIAQEMGSARALQSNYSKEAAFGDAQGAMAQSLRQSLEKMLPSLTRSAEGAGTSANSMRALLLQDAATRSSEAASALGLKAAVDYGNISANLSNTLAQLATKSDPVTTALLNALGIAKGAVTSSTENTSNYSNTSGTVNTVGTVNTTGTQDQYTPGAVNTREYEGSELPTLSAPSSSFTDAQLYSLNNNSLFDTSDYAINGVSFRDAPYEDASWSNYRL